MTKPPGRWPERERALALIGRIYEGALEPRLWPGIVEEIVAFMGAPKGKLFTPLLGTDNGGLAITVGIPEAADRLWATRYMKHDVWVQAGQAKGVIRSGNVLLDTDLVPEEEFVNSKIYREHLQHFDIGRLCSGIIFDGQALGMSPTFLSVARGLARPFGSEEREKMRVLVPHLSRALGVMMRLRSAELKSAATLAALDRLLPGVVLLDARGGVEFSNRTARQLLSEGDGIRLRMPPGGGQGRLAAELPRVQASLDAAIAECLRPGVLEVAHFSQGIAVPRPSGKRDYLLQFAPLPTGNDLRMGRNSASAIVFLNDPEAPISLDAALLKRLYRVTRAEARLAERICAGESLADAAEHDGISESTARTHLKHLFGKTGTSRQAELVRLLVALASTRSAN